MEDSKNDLLLQEITLSQVLLQWRDASFMKNQGENIIFICILLVGGLLKMGFFMKDWK